jgi:ketosteroid isomerase-like protein
MGKLTEQARRLNAAVNAHDLNPIGDIYAEDGEFVWPGFPPMTGRQAVVAFYATLLGAFPDIEVKILSIVERENEVGVEYEASGTNTGPLPGPGGEVPPTGRRLTMRAASIGSVDDDGRIKVHHEYFDRVEMLTQLGLMPAPQEAESGQVTGGASLGAPR